VPVEPRAEPESALRPVARLVVATDDDRLAAAIRSLAERYGLSFEQCADADAIVAHGPNELLLLDETCVDESAVEHLAQACVMWIREGDAQAGELGRPLLFTRLRELLTESGPLAATRTESIQPLAEVGVLVAEDNVTNRLVVGKMLDGWGARVHFAANGREAVELYRAHCKGIAVVLMDCEMPEMDGYAATREIRDLERGRRLPRMPIIALTAHAMPEFRRLADEAGMTDYVTKPIRKDVLLQALLAARSEGPARREEGSGPSPTPLPPVPPTSSNHWDQTRA